MEATATFSSSLRRRKEWATAVPVLLSSQKMKWRETKLEAHDLAVPFQRRPDQGGGSVFHFLLLSAADMARAEETRTKIEHLFHLAEHVGIVFLKGAGNEGANAFITFQIEMMHTLELPVLPLGSPTTLAASMEAFQRRLVTTLPSLPMTVGTTAVLPYCSSGQQLSKHSVNVLSGACAGFRALVAIMATEDGRDSIRDHIDSEADALFEFWDGGWAV